MSREERKIRDPPAIERIEVFNCAAAMIEQHREEFVARAAAGGWKTFRDVVGEVKPPMGRECRK